MTAIDRLGGLVQQVAIKAPCLVATTGNITLFGTQTIDGVTLTGGERVLVWQQTDPTQNGIYVCSGTQWTRDLDFNGPTQVRQGTIIDVAQGA